MRYQENIVTLPGMNLSAGNILLLLMIMIMLSSCASPSARLPQPPPSYVYNVESDVAASLPTANSLWNDYSNIIEDRKARRVNDLVTVNIVESLSGSQTAETDTSRASSADFDATNIFGANLDFNVQNMKVLKDLFKGSNVFEPKAAGKGDSDFKGAGDTKREGSLIATVTARVMEVMPNGNLVLEARKELTINEERQTLVLQGMVRSDDIDASNTIASNKIADARIFYVGKGVINEKQKPGWLVRGLDQVWPF
ncbi:MAG: flagellar basal body L-ring protein FlgH [Nitrospira sp.]|nr:flagellar basal body L-ring protein FlgH [Nitrospira sp.]